jgi:hypothetical protein
VIFGVLFIIGSSCAFFVARNRAALLRPSAAPSPTPKTPIRSIDRIDNQTSGSNIFYFGLTFWSFQPKSITRELKINFTSNIVDIRFAKGFLTLANTDSPTTKVAKFVVPVAGKYRISFYYSNKLVKQLFSNVTFLEGLSPRQSSLICFGETYESRWCRARNICWRDRWFTFFGIPDAIFNRSIMTPGSRPVPLDYPSCRKIIRFHTTSRPFPFRILSHVVPELSFITCRWYSMQYLWHSLFDYTLPLFWTMKLNGGVNRSNRIYLVDENTSKKGYQFIPAFTSGEVPNVRVNEAENNNTCWKDAVLGFPKSEYNITPEKWSSMLELPYEYPLEAYRGFRDHMISFFCSPEIFRTRCEPDAANPRVVVFFRNSKMRDIDNKEDLLAALRRWCPHCTVDAFLYLNQTYGEQMEAICNASILISMHGSQLSHMVWMKVDDREKKTSVIEILPYMYTCRNWYEQIANGAEIKYFKWVNTHRNNTRSGRDDQRNYERCLRGEMPCLGECHDLLRDQPTVVNLTEFEVVFRGSLAHVSKK